MRKNQARNSGDIVLLQLKAPSDKPIIACKFDEMLECIQRNRRHDYTGDEEDEVFVLASEIVNKHAQTQLLKLKNTGNKACSLSSTPSTVLLEVFTLVVLKGLNLVTNAIPTITDHKEFTCKLQFPPA